jgi:hypothetical protein
VVLSNKPLNAVEGASKRRKVSRSALEQRLKQSRELELEQRDRKGYLARPQQEDEFRVWEDAASWPRP